MSNEDLIRLIKYKEQSVVGVLVVNDLVKIISEQDGYTIDNIAPTELGKSIVGKSIYFDDEWLKNLIKKWEPSLRGSKEIIRKRCESFISKTGCNLETIEELVDKWLMDRKYPYCGKMDNFFSKKDDDGNTISQIEILYESIDDKKDFRFDQA